MVCGAFNLCILINKDPHLLDDESDDRTEECASSRQRIPRDLRIKPCFASNIKSWKESLNNIGDK